MQSPRMPRSQRPDRPTAVGKASIASCDSWWSCSACSRSFVPQQHLASFGNPCAARSRARLGFILFYARARVELQVSRFEFCLPRVCGAGWVSGGWPIPSFTLKTTLAGLRGSPPLTQGGLSPESGVGLTDATPPQVFLSLQASTKKGAISSPPSSEAIQDSPRGGVHLLSPSSLSAGVHVLD